MRDHTHCSCGAPVHPPLPMCKACYGEVQEAQRNRGRNPVIKGAHTSDRTFRFRLMP